MRHWTATCYLPNLRSLEWELNPSLPRKREYTGAGRMNSGAVSRRCAVSSTGPVFKVQTEKMDSRFRGNDGSQLHSKGLQSCQKGEAGLTRFPLTPALSLEGEGVAEQIQSLWVVIQHLAQLLFGHTRRAEQNQDDFRLEGLGLGKGRAGGLAHTRMNNCRLRDRDYRHGLAFGEIGDDPGWEQPAELRQGLFHGLSVRHPVVEGYRNRTSSSLAVPGNGRKAVRHIGHVNGDVVQSEGVGGRVFLRQVHLRRHREVGNHGVNGFPLYDAAGESRQVCPVAAGLRRRDDNGERRSGGRGFV